MNLLDVINFFLPGLLIGLGIQGLFSLHGITPPKTMSLIGLMVGICTLILQILLEFL